MKRWVLSRKSWVKIQAAVFGKMLLSYKPILEGPASPKPRKFGFAIATGSNTFASPCFVPGKKWPCEGLAHFRWALESSIAYLDERALLSTFQMWLAKLEPNVTGCPGQEKRLALFHSVDSSSSKATEKTWASSNGKTMPGPIKNPWISQHNWLQSPNLAAQRKW